MKKKEIILLAMGLICTLQVWGQRVLDTLYVNENKNVALFFPSPIRRAITGHDNFVFSYDRKEAGHYGLLQGMEGADSNLLVITSDNQVYAYVLKYKRTLLQLNHFVGEGDSIGSIQPSKKLIAKHEPRVVETSRYERFSKLLLHGKPKNMLTKRKKGIRLRLEDMVYDGREVYLTLQIRNRSGIDFELDLLEVFRVNGSVKRRASYQEISLEPVHRYGFQNRVRDGEMIRFVYVLPKFVLGDKERLKLVLEELYGNRRVELKQ